MAIPKFADETSEAIVLLIKSPADEFIGKITKGSFCRRLLCTPFDISPFGGGTVRRQRIKTLISMPLSQVIMPIHVKNGSSSFISRESRVIDLEDSSTIGTDDPKNAFIITARAQQVMHDDGPVPGKCDIYKRQIYSLAFNPFQTANGMPIFAAGTYRYINVYATPVDQQRIVLVRSFFDGSDDDNYYAMTWAYDIFANEHRLVVGGERGFLRVLDVSSGKSVMMLRSHGMSINDVRTDPSNSMIVASGSADCSVRLWNIRIGHALAVIGGLSAHLDQVLSLDGQFIVTGGMDHTVRLWNIGMDEIQNLIHQSMEDDCDVENLNDRKPLILSNALAVNNDLHFNYVDGVRFIGRYVVTRDASQQGTIFRFGHYTEPMEQAFQIDGVPDTVATRLSVLNLTKSSNWAQRFDVDPLRKWIAFAMLNGTVAFFNMENRVPNGNPDFVLDLCSNARSDQARVVRGVAFGANGRILVAVADDGSIFRVERKFLEEKAPKAASGIFKIKYSRH